MVEVGQWMAALHEPVVAGFALKISDGIIARTKLMGQLHEAAMLELIPHGPALVPGCSFKSQQV